MVRKMQELEYKLQNSHSACCCTLLKKQTIDAFALNASFQKRRNGRTSMQRLQLEPSLAVDSEWLLPNDGIRP
ncbi:hypothetical protein T12_5750 [Trichinella patagoniensis]|uniref:Uncharacterized protein n=1 Tax=Trichinella patagoniensis TaxID=990121 RepID=A0A0V1AF27_9BILA|nr:hypothetical protein T12_5750 [Trichinella patagoniensis]